MNAMGSEVLEAIDKRCGFYTRKELEVINVLPRHPRHWGCWKVQIGITARRMTIDNWYTVFRLGLLVLEKILGPRMT